MQIDFDPDKHEYSVGGIKIPSVSEILAPLSAERYDGLNPWMLKAAAEKGRAVHEATELMDYGVEPEADPEIEPYLLAYQTFLCEHEVEWEMVERIVAEYRNRDELPIYCGTVDRFGKIDGQPAVVDIKTYASLSTDALLSASCQTELYKCAIYCFPPDTTEEEEEKWFENALLCKRYVLHLRKDGSYRLVDLYDFDKKRGFNSSSTAWELFHVHYAITEARKNRKRGKHERTD